MLDLPMINPENVSRDFIDVFGGYNHNLRIGDNEFYDMKNMTSSCYPLLASSPKRGDVPASLLGQGTIVGMLYRSSLYCATIPTPGKLSIYRDGDLLNTFDTALMPYTRARELVMMGAYLLIFPDKVYINVEDDEDCGSIEAEMQTQEDVVVQACTADGTPIKYDCIGEQPPKNPIDGTIWLDISDTYAVFKKYYASQASWQSVIANCVLITGGDIDTSGFKEGDGVRISGFADSKLSGLNNTSIIYKMVEDGFVLSTILDMNYLQNEIESIPYPVKEYTNHIQSDTSDVTIYCNDAYQADHFKDMYFTHPLMPLMICTSSEAATASTNPDYPYMAILRLDKQYPGDKHDMFLYSLENYSSINSFVVEDPITFSRKLPAMDYIIESKNRLWGCRYGENSDGDFVNEIYCSKLGDFKNWQCYEGISTDSYAASCGTDGDWTGAVSYLGYPVFYKENYIHTVYGSYPAQFQINSITARGVKGDCSKSIAILNEVLYYMSPDGVCAYDGSLPTKISDAFGNIKYTKAVACAHKDKYYIHMKESGSNNRAMMVFDASRRVWHKEEGISTTSIIQLVAVDDDIYAFASGGSLTKSLFGSGGLDTDPVQWYVETGKYGLSQADSKYISKLNLRMELSEGASAIVSIQYDSSQVWERLCAAVRPSINPFTLAIKPKRCDHFQLRLEGAGDAKIYSIAKTIEQGSDVV